MEVANRYKDKIWVIRNEKNLGIVDNFNKAVSLTKGDYILFFWEQIIDFEAITLKNVNLPLIITLMLQLLTLMS